MRHGETEYNAKNLCQGVMNDGLNDNGRRQCQRLKQKILSNHYDICYSSPLVRAMETALILVGDRVEIVPDHRLIERDMGQLEGQPRSEYNSSQFWDYERDCHDFDVESIQSLFQRNTEFLEEIKKRPQTDHILIVSHGGVIRALHHLLHHHSLHGNLGNLDVPNCYIEEIDVKEK